jgi:hypothetical protein
LRIGAERDESDQLCGARLRCNFHDFAGRK